MAGRKFIFDPPDRFIAGSVGQPGQRTFFLQARRGSAVLSVALEKVQVALLAERIGALIEELGRRGIELPPATSAGRHGPARGTPPQPAADLEEPVVEAFRIGSMTITYDDARRDVTLEARELGEEDDADEGDDDDARHLFRVRLTLGDARTFAQGAMQVVAAGRPPCPICGEPLDPQGHICLRRNGYVM